MTLVFVLFAFGMGLLFGFIIGRTSAIGEENER